MTFSMALLDGLMKQMKQMVLFYTRVRGYKTFFMLNSAEHDILNAHMYKNIKKKLSIFQAQISLECYFFCP